ncbi:ATP-dependent helicase [Clostridium sp. YIM B02515]|uniref:DNA 3'-5' helicase n=1 Tax=Clostridium rhizosphaerae TaxID=2803861 RepID=A0ABS1T7L8_9CLOT|nr:ATP-dependent helicase [Clostridium rhizosphaerae]MBL4935261.1 ATP-dependent helicase [Clostridium rhizosphaerae]
MMKNSINSEYFKMRDSIIEMEFDYLDEQQKKAVFNNNKNSLVLACPGSGKTTVLINRVVYLVKYGETYQSEHVPENISLSDIENLKEYVINKKAKKKVTLDQRLTYLLGFKKVNSNNIIVITFTKAAAANMKKRFENLSKGMEGMPFFGTFHGLFYKILLRHFGKIHLIDSSEGYRLISNILLSHMEEINEDKIKEVRTKISLFKCGDGDLESFDTNIDKKIFTDCFESYERYKEEKNLMDFDDLQIKFREFINSNSKILNYYSKGFKYMLIDEFQDCDNIQLEILKLLNQYNSIFAVGDEDQCIYSFRGSRPDYMVDFNKKFTDGNKLYLSTNYRSTKNIVSAAANIIKNNTMRNEKSMNAFRDENKSFEILSCYDDNSQAETIALNIEKLKSLTNYSYEDNAVLYRTNIESRSLIDAFIRKKIPFKLLDKEYNFFDHFICKDLIAYLKLSIYPEDAVCFKRVINKPFRFISKLSLEKVSSSFIKIDCFEIIKNLESTPVFQIKNLEKLQKDINRLNKMSLYSAVQFISADLGYHDYIVEYSKKFKIQLSELEDIIFEFREAASQYNSIISFMAHVEQVKEELQNNNKNSNKDAVTLSTVHGVKGMEFKNVFIINCVEEYMPHVNSMEDSLEEERRLFYVALTRAIDNEFICIPKNVRGKLKKPSRFIEECKINIFENLQAMYAEGEEVIHNSFGKGKILNIDNNVVEIQFGNSINRKFDIVVLHNNGIIKKLS